MGADGSLKRKHKGVDRRRIGLENNGGLTSRTRALTLMSQAE